MAEKILNTRILMKTATLEEWNSSTLPLKKGELAIATIASSAGNGLSEPVCMIKIGEDDVKPFKDLEWNLYAKASDVLAACKSEATLTAFVNNVINKAGIATNEALNALTGRVTTAEGKIATAEGKITTAEGKITALEGLVGDKKVAIQISEALANYTTTTDMNAAIASAKSEAINHANGLNTAMDNRVKTVEGKAHTHTFVESELNLVKTGDVAKWNAAEQNAKDYADGLDKAMDSRVDALEAKFGTGEGNVDSKIAAAVAAEAEIARAAEQANAKAITDLTNGAVKANTEAIETLIGGTPVAEQIENALNVEVDGAKVEKYALATALAAEIETARAAEKANADAIKVLNGNADAAGSVDYKIAQKFATLMENPDEAMNSIKELVDWTTDHAQDALEMSNQVTANKNAIEVLNGDSTKAGSVAKQIADAIAAENLDQYATDGELSTLAGRVTTVENDLNTATTGLKAKMTSAEGRLDALEGLTGGEKVADAIEDAVNPLAERIVELEKVDHDHSNKTVLDGIKDTDITAWNAKVDGVTAAADSGLKATRTDNAIAIEIDTTLTWVFDCGGAE